MKTYSELKAAVAKGQSPSQKASAFVDGFLDIVSNNKSNPQGIETFVSETRENRQSLIHDLTASA